VKRGAALLVSRSGQGSNHSGGEPENIKNALSTET
tara:strand:- start:173 stop:277 length:105 start_codon:yes stop_codon:yes gene_type:complete